MTDRTDPRTGSPLPRDFYACDGLTLARALLGKVLVRREGDRAAACVITETEAYMGVGDRASHAWHYRGLAASLSELSETFAYQEFVELIARVFHD